MIVEDVMSNVFVGLFRYFVYGVFGFFGVGDGGVWCLLKGWCNKFGGVVVDLDLFYVLLFLLSE